MIREIQKKKGFDHGGGQEGGEGSGKAIISLIVCHDTGVIKGFEVPEERGSQSTAKGWVNLNWSKLRA